MMVMMMMMIAIMNMELTIMIDVMTILVFVMMLEMEVMITIMIMRMIIAASYIDAYYDQLVNCYINAVLDLQTTSKGKIATSYTMYDML